MNTEKGLAIFEHEEFGSVRTVNKDGETWFVGKDVANALGYTDTDQALRKHCKALQLLKAVDSTGLDIPSRGLTIIPERDLYRLVMRSKLPSAEKFEEWVVAEVLPSIRKTGGYNLDPKMRDMIELLPKGMGDACEKLSAAYKSIDILKARADRYESTAELLASCEQNITVGSFAKLLYKQGINVGRNTLFTWLRKDGFVMKNDRYDRNHPTQKALKDGLLVLEEDVVERDDGPNIVTQRILITPAGQIFFANFYKHKKEAMEEDYSEFPEHIQEYFAFNKKYNIVPEVKDFYNIPKNHPRHD